MKRSAPFSGGLSRREALRLAAAGVVGCSTSGWIESLAADAAGHPSRRKSCILLWMNGGPSQIDTFDPKPGHPNGGPLKPIQTAAPGVMFSEYLPQLSKHAKDLAVIRGMSTKEGDHGRATYLMRIGTMPQGAIQYPFIGSSIAKELSPPDAELPDVVSIAPFRFFNQQAYSSGFLGPRFAPLVIGESSFGQPDQTPNFYDQVLRVADIDRPAEVDSAHQDARVGLLDDLEQGFRAARPDGTAASHHSAYERAVRMMKSASARAFKL